MQTVTTDWTDNQAKSITSKATVQVIYDIIDTDLDDPTITDNGHLTMSDADKLWDTTSLDITKYATMEKRLALTDGSFKIKPNSAPYAYNAFVSDLASDVSGEFTTDPLITLTFDAVTSATAPSVTIKFSETYGEYADSYTLTVYNGASVVDQNIVTGNTSQEVEESITLTDFDKITLEVNEWGTAYHRARIEKLYVGVQRVYDNTELKQFSIERRCGIFSESLPVLKLKFGVDNSEDQFDPYNPDSLTAYVLNKQEVTAKIGFDIDGTVEYINGGKYYMSGWGDLTSANMASFEADGITSLMSNTYKKGILDTTSISLYDLAEDVLEDADLPLNADSSNPWELDTSLQSIYTTAPLGLHTHAECLQLIANAGECIFYVDLSNQIIIKPRVETVQDYTIEPFNEYSDPDLSYIEPVSTLEVNVHNYSVEDNLTTVYSQEVNGGDTYNITWTDAIKNAFANFIGDKTDYSSEAIFNHYIVNLSETTFVIYYNLYTDSDTYKSYLVYGSCDDMIISFASQIEIDETTSTEETYALAMCRIDDERFAVGYQRTTSSSTTSYIKVGVIGSGSILLGDRNSCPATTDLIHDIKLVGSKLVLAYYDY